jgi:small GTP-binding protein
VSTPFSKIDEIIPYAYIAAEKASQILNDKEISILIPNLRNGKKEMILHEDHSNSKSIINKIAIIGDDFVGKSTLINMYVNGEFNDEYKPTIGISIVEKELQLMKNVNLIFKLFDFGGLKTFAKVRRHFYRGSDAIIVIFDYSRPDSLEKLNEWIEESIQFIDDHSVPYLIVGNKIDKVNERKNIRDKLEIFANQYNFPIFETSSLTGEGIDEIFMYLTSNIKF